VAGIRKPKPPSELRAEGRRVWREIVADTAGQGLELDARELTWLRHAAKLADRVAALEDAMTDQPLVVPGHASQPVAHPLLGEIRQTQALLAQTLGRLRVDVSESTGGIVNAGGNRFRAAANARWNRGA
jgi:hypothetical protein